MKKFMKNLKKIYEDLTVDMRKIFLPKEQYCVRFFFTSENVTQIRWNALYWWGKGVVSRHFYANNGNGIRCFPPFVSTFGSVVRTN